MGYQIMFYGGLALTIICLGLAIGLFIKLDIKQALADLTGLKWLKSKQGSSFQYQANVTESGKRTTSQIVIRRDQDASFTSSKLSSAASEAKQANSFIETEYLPTSTASSDQQINSHAETEYINEPNITRHQQQNNLTETVLLPTSEETTLLTDEDASFMIDEDIVRVEANEVITNGGEKSG
ncbi:hypothetical protein [Amphibacillus jilinensis]|uniref:hypothetical protein n=1 Tax=Amphibacillus jilinensis TaxID=1216008 RepID=UPI0002FE7F76|nr:hypothetical protein [Amphibacillus jilinensis]